MAKKNKIELIEGSELLKKSKYTFDEYSSELKEFQRMLADLLIDSPSEYVRYSDIISEVEKEGRDKGVSNNNEFRRGVEALKTLSKNTSIILSGKNNEDRIHKTLCYLQRDNALYRNVYIEDEEENSEIDEIVVTNSGVVILEIKGIKGDLTIDENGRLLYENSIQYKDYSITEKMIRKRRIVSRLLKKEFEERGINKPVRVDSYVVFVCPKGTYYHVNDKCTKEWYCFSSNVLHYVENYRTSVTYDEIELSVIKNLISTLDCKKKIIPITLPIETIRADIINALRYIIDDEKKEAYYWDNKGSEEKDFIEEKCESLDFGALRKHHTQDTDYKKKLIKTLVFALPLPITATITGAAISALKHRSIRR